jgi:signal transduction histidine kinase/PAS domain-containing protein
MLTGRGLGLNLRSVGVTLTEDVQVEIEHELRLEELEVMAEALVQVDRKNLRTLFTQAPAAIAVVRGPELRYELANPLHQGLAGDRPLLGRPLREAFSEPEALPLVTLIEKAYRTGEPAIAEELAVVLPSASDRKPRQVFLSGVMQPMRDARGHVDGVMVFTHDVTELVLGRQRVAAIEERMRLALDAGDVGFWEYDPRSTFITCDTKFKALLGFGPDSNPTTADILAAIHPDDRERVRSATIRTVQGANGGEYFCEYRTTGTSAHGARWISARGRTFFDASGAAVRFLGTATDITRDRLALERTSFLAKAGTLLASNLDYRYTLAQVTRLAVPHLADCCSAELVNERGEVESLELVHVDPGKLETARAIRRLYWTDANPQSVNDRVVRTGEPAFIPEVTDEVLVKLARDDRHLRLLRELDLRSVIVMPLLGRERVIGAVAFFHACSGRRYSKEDLAFAEELARRAAIAIDNARLYRAAQSAIQRRDDFLSVASHELKTPVTTLLLQIEGFMCELDQGPIDAVELRSRLGKSLEQVHRLSKLVEDLLDVSRASSGHLELSKATVDLAELAQAVVARFREAAARAGSPIQMTAGGRTTGRWDANRLEQVLTNLLSNALKFAPGKPIDVLVENRGNRVVLCVRDRGPGVAPDDRQRIFDRFERTRTAEGVGGIGLGLWISKQIVRAHGGDIRVDGEHGEGASFWVDLPL